MRKTCVSPNAGDESFSRKYYLPLFYSVYVYSVNTYIVFAYSAYTYSIYVYSVNTYSVFAQCEKPIVITYRVYAYNAFAHTVSAPMAPTAIVSVIKVSTLVMYSSKVS